MTAPIGKKSIIKLTANFERNLVEIEQFLLEAEATNVYDVLLDELLDTVIPNLEQFPGIGRPFLSRQPHSVETTKALESLQVKLSALTADLTVLREYVLAHYLVLYAQIGSNLYLLAIRHHRQLSFDSSSQWRDA